MNIFAIVDYGRYPDEYNFEFIKIDKRDKEKFTQFCKQSEVIYGQEESLALRGWAQEVESVVGNDGVDILTIKEHMERVRQSVALIDKKREHHYLFEKKDMVADLLKYEFLEVRS